MIEKKLMIELEKWMAWRSAEDERLYM